MHEEKKAKSLLLFVVIIWGLNVVMVKYLSGFFPPLELATYRIGAAAVLLGVVVWKMYGFVKLSLKEWLYIAGIAVSGIFLHQILLGAGIQTTDASTSSLILGLNPLMTSLLAFAIFREALTWRKISGLVLGLLGVALVIFGDSWEQTASLAFGTGELLIFLSMLVYVISGLIIKKATQTVPVMVVTGYSHVLATVLLLCFTGGKSFITGEVAALPADWFVWGVLIFSGWVATALGAIWWNSGIRLIGAGRTAMFLNGMPIMSLLFSVLLLGESITWVHGIGFLMAFFAIYLGTSQGKVNMKRQQGEIAKGQPA
ncbi:EamA domain-containing membrane protein RarD [Tumebacillus sp. BK434]|uniref:DMT family transporter n=1 Tax=Tumebacillus sp. BK434 TaxID=2512169 RepID=UPI00104E2AF6|nr:DMT family transporter [Tumebacillus sp. BK434]TCP55430.1 EamA domain-containing membrane protein RarD [Tumebacillus sp. BK434]